MLLVQTTQPQALHLVARALAPCVGRLLRTFACNRGVMTCAAPAFEPEPTAAPLSHFAHEACIHLKARHPLAVQRTSEPNFTAILSHYRSHYPEPVLAKLATMFSGWRRQHAPLAVDIAVGAEGRTGVELAKRGFRVLSVGCDDMVLNRTRICASTSNARLEAIAAEEEPALIPDSAADLVTCMHGLHLLDVRSALAEVHRILKPGGMLVVAWNDRDLGQSSVGELEGVLERHLDPSYCRHAAQRTPDAWAGRLQAGGLFKLTEYSTHSNPVVLRNLATLSDVLSSQACVRKALLGPARKAFNSEVRALVEARFGEGAVLLPMLTRVYVLRKAAPAVGSH